MTDHDSKRWTRAPESLRKDMGLDDQDEGPQEASEISNSGPKEDYTDGTDQIEQQKRLRDIPAHKRPGRMAARSEGLAERGLRKLEEEERQQAKRAKRIREREIQQGEFPSVH